MDRAKRRLKGGVLVAVAAVALATTPACLFRSHHVESHLSNSPLKQATVQELVESVNAAARAIRTMNATVDINTIVGGEKKGKVTEYSEIRGYVLFQQPSMLRMIGLLPVVRTRAFDMVSDGHTFKLSVPPKNRFVTGPNDMSVPSANPLENLRPQIILDALQVHEIDPLTEIAVLEGGSQYVVDPKDSKRRLTQPDYRLDILRRNTKGEWFMALKIYFNRADLKPYRVEVFDRGGNVATDVRYGNYSSYDGIDFPAEIEIARPQEEYQINLKMVTLKLNTPLKPEQFELQQPAGAEVKVLGALASPQNNSGSQ